MAVLIALVFFREMYCQDIIVQFQYSRTVYFNISEWKRYLKLNPQKWVWHYVSWLKFGKGKIHVVHYEDLLRNFDSEMKKLLKFLDFPFSDQLLNCVEGQLVDILEKDRASQTLMNDILFDKNTRLTLSMYEKVLEKSYPKR